MVSTKTSVLEAWQKVKMRKKTQKLGGAIVGLVVGKTLCSRTFRDSVSQVWNVLLTCTALNM